MTGSSPQYLTDYLAYHSHSQSPGGKVRLDRWTAAWTLLLGGEKEGFLGRKGAMKQSMSTTTDIDSER